jgi:hypothetical protein
MRVLVTGSSGLVGTALLAHLEAKGDDVLRLVRGDRPIARTEIRWNPAAGAIDEEGLEGLDAVVHLAGENLADGRWTRARKDRIWKSRVDGTQLLAETLARCGAKPRVLVSASAVGYYGDRGAEPLDEASTAGRGFLAKLCAAWEAATEPAAGAGIRVVRCRAGIVLSAAGGALPRMLPVFRLGLGGPLGSGSQYVPWIALDDLLRVIHTAIVTESLRGPVNAVAPTPVTSRGFSLALGRVLRRPAILPVPAFVLRIAFGELADEGLLASQRVAPARLLAAGFAFRHPEIREALAHALER